MEKQSVTAGLKCVAQQVLHGRDLVEVGTRNGDGINCFARVTKSAVAVELDAEYCRKLRARAKRLRDEGAGDYAVVCRRYEDGTPDGDVFTRWQQHPHLTNSKGLRVLRDRQRAGAIRRGAQALLLFDASWPLDVHGVDGLATLGPLARWRAVVPFNERALCEARTPSSAQSRCSRASGQFTLALIDLNSSALSRHLGHAHATARRSRGAAMAAAAADKPRRLAEASSPQSSPEPYMHDVAGGRTAGRGA